MNRCDYCTQRYTWDCQEWRSREDVVCDGFVLDWDTIPEDVRRVVQRFLVGQPGFVPARFLSPEDRL